MFCCVFDLAPDFELALPGWLLEVEDGARLGGVTTGAGVGEGGTTMVGPETFGHTAGDGKGTEMLVQLMGRKLSSTGTSEITWLVLTVMALVVHLTCRHTCDVPCDAMTLRVTRYDLSRKEHACVDWQQCIMCCIADHSSIYRLL